VSRREATFPAVAVVPFGTFIDGPGSVKIPITRGAGQAAHREVVEMSRARWFVVGFLLIAAVLGGSLNALGPFGDHPRIAYDQVFADYAARRIDHISQWRDQLEIVEVDGTVLRAVVPPGRDFASDFDVARHTYMNAFAYSRLPDPWLVVMTPWIPSLLALAAVLIWGTAVARSRRQASGIGPAGSPQAVG
jgi:hypothetical protein